MEKQQIMDKDYYASKIAEKELELEDVAENTRSIKKQLTALKEEYRKCRDNPHRPLSTFNKPSTASGEEKQKESKTEKKEAKKGKEKPDGNTKGSGSPDPDPSLDTDWIIKAKEYIHAERDYDPGTTICGVPIYHEDNVSAELEKVDCPICQRTFKLLDRVITEEKQKTEVFTTLDAGDE